MGQGEQPAELPCHTVPFLNTSAGHLSPPENSRISASGTMFPCLSRADAAAGLSGQLVLASTLTFHNPKTGSLLPKSQPRVDLTGVTVSPILKHSHQTRKPFIKAH